MLLKAALWLVTLCVLFRVLKLTIREFNGVLAELAITRMRLEDLNKKPRKPRRRKA